MANITGLLEEYCVSDILPLTHVLSALIYEAYYSGNLNEDKKSQYIFDMVASFGKFMKDGGNWLDLKYKNDYTERLFALAGGRLYCFYRVDNETEKMPEKWPKAIEIERVRLDGDGLVDFVEWRFSRELIDMFNESEKSLRDYGRIDRFWFNIYMPAMVVPADKIKVLTGEYAPVL